MAHSVDQTDTKRFEMETRLTSGAIMANRWPVIGSIRSADGSEKVRRLNELKKHGGPGRNSAGALCYEEKLAILQCFPANSLYGDRNRLQVAV